MKKLFFVLGIIYCSYISVQAQAQDNSQNMEAQIKKVLKDSLSLTDVQIDSVMVIQQAYQPQIQTIVMDQNSTMEQKMQKVQPIRDAIRARLQKILTAEQMAKMDTMEQNMRQRVMQQQGNKNRVYTGFFLYFIVIVAVI